MICRSVTLLSCAKTAEAIKMPFALKTRLGPRKHSRRILYCGHSTQYSHLVIIRLYRSWFRGTAVERRSLAGELSLSSAKPVADGWPLMWVNRPLYVNQPGQLSLSFLRVHTWVLRCNWMSPTSVTGGAIWLTLTKERQTLCIWIDCSNKYLL